MTTPISGEHWTTIMTKAFYIILHVYLSAAWTFPVSLYLVTGFAVYYHFKEHSIQFRESIESDHKAASDIEIHRKRHQLLCHLTDAADECFSLHTASIICLEILLLLIILYLIIWYKAMSEDPYFLSTAILWIISGLYNMGIVCLCGALIATKAHAPLQYIHDIDLRKVTQETSAQILMFVSKLDGAQIGLSAMNLFVIDKQTILSIFGIVITYFVVLVQFQQSSMDTGLQEDRHASIREKRRTVLSVSPVIIGDSVDIDMATPTKPRHVWSTTKVTPLQNQSEECRRKNIYNNIFRPLFVSMALLGLCHGDIIWGTETKGKIHSFGRIANKVYSCCVILLTWTIALKTFVLYAENDGTGPTIFKTITTQIWYLLCAWNTAVFYRMCSKECRLRKCIETVVRRVGSSCDCNESTKCLRRLVWLCTAAAWLAVIVNMFVHISTLSQSKLVTMMKPIKYVESDESSRLYATGLSSAFFLFQLVSYTFPGFLICVIAMTLCHLFESLASQPDLEERPGDVFSLNRDDELECLRQQHQELCHLVSETDSIFRAYIASVLLAHQLIKTIHDIDLANVSSKTFIQAQMFLHKLTGPTIGLTVFGLFTIDKTLVSSMLGMLLTYCIILAQFKQSAIQTPTSAGMDCNCSTVTIGP
ncbi:hypothetical protein ScPMuIL_006899 [Solemya velum]